MAARVVWQTKQGVCPPDSPYLRVCVLSRDLLRMRGREPQLFTSRQKGKGEVSRIRTDERVSEAAQGDEGARCTPHRTIKAHCSATSGQHGVATVYSFCANDGILQNQLHTAACRGRTL